VVVTDEELRRFQIHEDDIVINRVNSRSHLGKCALIPDAVNQSSINQNDVNNFELFLPPINLQNKFASIVEQVEQVKQKMLASLEEMDNHFNALMQRYFG